MVTLEQAMSQKMAALIQGMSQRTTTRGIEIGQGFGQQPQIEVATTNVDIPIGYPINSLAGPEERPTVTSLVPIPTDALLNIVLFGLCNPQGFVLGPDLPSLGPGPQQIYHP